MAELIIYMAIFALSCVFSLWAIEQYCPKLAEKIENFFKKFDNE